MFIASLLPGRTAFLLLAISFSAVMGMLLVDPIAQDSAYHLFSDRRQWWLIPNSLDVLSNIPFIITGLLGLQRCLRQPAVPFFWPFIAIFAGVFLTAFGSSWYHWSPSNATLVWDRLPMTIAFMGLFTLVLADRINPLWRYALLPFLLLGMASVYYWGWTETQGRGDLRFYALVQFLPMLLIPLMLILYPAPRQDFACYIGLLCCYALAKLLEYFDAPIFALTDGVISGHSLKHLSAALATAFLYTLLIRYQHSVKQE